MYDMHLAQPWLDYVLSGRKTIEGRIRKGKYSAVMVSDLFNIEGSLFKVSHVSSYNSFRDMLTDNDIDTVLPGVKSVDDGVLLYRSFYPLVLERLHGVVAITLVRV